MTRKTLILLALWPVVVFGQRIEPRNELLWEISGNGLKSPSYLYGSFHSNDKRLFNFPDSLYYAMDQVQKIVLETDVFSLFDEWDTRIDYIDMEYDNKGMPYVDNPYATATYYGDEDGMPQFIDAYFMQYCKNTKKKFSPLETVDFQLGLLSDVGEVDYTDFHMSSMIIDKESMISAYIDGNVSKLDEILRNSLSYYVDGYDKIITDRNVGMADGLDSLLQLNDRIFCAVGVGHLPGIKGMINLLRLKGYKLRKVTASYSDTELAHERNVKSARNYMYENKNLHLRAEFGSKPMELKGQIDGYELKLIYREFGQGNTYEIEVYPRTMEIGLDDLAAIYIASPEYSPARKITLSNGGEAWEGIADSYPEGLYWARVVMSEDKFLVIKAYGGNKFMNSPRPMRFFDKVILY